MILNQSVEQRGGLRDEVGLFVNCRLLRAREGGFDERAVEDTVAGFAEMAHQLDVERDRFRV